MKQFHKYFQLLILMFASASVNAVPVKLKIMVNNIAPAGGVALTPVWVGFHDGNFDGFNSGEKASSALEALAEDGNTDLISSAFSTASGSDSVVLGNGNPPLIFSGTSGQAMLTVDSSNRYFSYASMVLASSDYFIGNDNPLEHDVSPLLNGTVNKISFFVGQSDAVYDAGTEVNDFNTSAGNPIFSGLPVGQSVPGEGVDQNGVVSAIDDPYGDFANVPAGFDLTLLNFNQYPNGIAEITITAVPLPAALPLTITGLTLLFGISRYRRQSDVG